MATGSSRTLQPDPRTLNPPQPHNQLSKFDIQKSTNVEEFSRLKKSTDCGDCEAADTASWNSLPLDLQAFILGKLEYLDLFRAKTQAKVFKERIDSNNFHSWRGKVKEGLLTALYFFVRDDIWCCEGYDLITKTWMRLPPFKNLPRLDPDSFKDHCFCAAGCLICANVGKVQERLIVFNPLTGKQRELPHLVNRRFPVLMHMIVDASSYKIIVAGSSRLGDEHLSKTTEVYDSRTRLWKVTEELPGPLFALNEHQTGAYINGILYCVAFLEGGDRGKGLYAYSVAEERWLPEHTKALPYSTASNIVQVLESHGELYLFSELEQERGRVQHRIDVLDPTRGAGEWKNIMTEAKPGNPALQTYPEFATVPFGEGKLCVHNTIDHNGVVYDVMKRQRVATSLAPPPPRAARATDMGFFTLNPLTFVFEAGFKGLDP